MRNVLFSDHIKEYKHESLGLQRNLKQEQMLI